MTNSPPFFSPARSGLGGTAAWGLCTLALTLTLTFALSAAAHAQVSAARVMAVAGSAKAIDPQGRERLLEKGAEVRTGERIVTAEGALVQLRLNDGGYLSVRPGTEMVVDRFVLDDKDASKSSFLVSLVKGGFRSITGLIGRTNPSGYQIRGGTSTLGVRGTDHEPMMIPEGIPSLAKLGEPGLYDKVNDGETFIRNAQGLLALKRGEIGFSPLRPDKPPHMLRGMPDFYKIDLKTDARDPKEGDDGNASGRKKADAGDMLRPSTAARRAALKPVDGAELPPPKTLLPPPPLTPLTPLTLQPALIEPIKPLLAPTTTVTDPPKILLAPTTTLIAPPPTTIAPTTTLIAPTTTTAPKLTTTIITK